MHRILVAVFFVSSALWGQETEQEARQRRLAELIQQVEQEEAGKTDQQKAKDLTKINPTDSRTVKEGKKRLQREEKLAKERRKKAEENLQKAQKQRSKDVKRIADTSASAELSGCPIGSVWIGEHVASPRYYTPTASIKINNTSGMVIDEIWADRHYGVVVRNLCNGGSLAIHLIAGSDKPLTVCSTLSARGRNSRGEVAIFTFGAVCAQRPNAQFQSAQSPIWNIGK